MMNTRRWLDTGCGCQAHKACLRHLPPSFSNGAELRAEGLDREMIGAVVEERGLSPTGLSRRALAGLGMAGLMAGVASPAPSRARSFERTTWGETDLGAVHELPSTAETVRFGILDPAARPALTIRSGDVVHYPDTWLHWGNQPTYGMTFSERQVFRRAFPNGPYSLVGPVAVEGAEPGDVIECRMLRLKPIDWGWNSAPLGVGALPEDFDAPYLHYFRFNDERTETEFSPGVVLPLRPVQAVMAVQPVGDQPVSGILTGAYGGNLKLAELTEGTSLFLPVQVSGANLWTGDSHAAQGDGIVNQTGIETAMEDLRIQYVLHKRVAMDGPIVDTPSHWIVLAEGDELGGALTSTLRRLIAWLTPACRLSAADVYALASVVGSFRITQYAHQIESNYTSIPSKAVHLMLPKEIFSADIQRQISQSVRPGS